MPFDPKKPPFCDLIPSHVFVLLTLPDPPPWEVLRRHIRDHAEVIRAGGLEQALANAKVLHKYVDAMEEELKAKSR